MSARKGAWAVILAGFIVLGITFSARALLGIAMPLWEADLGWSRSFVSSTGAAALLVMAVMGPLTGYAVDRWGARWLLCVGLAAAGAACLVVSRVHDPLVFVLSYGLLGAIGFGLVSMNAVGTAAAQAMPDRVGLASGIATSGSTGGQLVFVPMLAAVVAAVGWRDAYLAAGAVCIGLAPAVLALVGSPSTAIETGNQTRGFVANARAVLVSPAFIILFATFFICGVTTAGVIETHLLPYAAACGFDTMSSASAYGLLSAFNLLGMIGAGWLTERVHRGRLLAVIYGMRAIAFVLLMLIGDDFRLLLLFAVLFGVFDYSTVPVTVSLVATHLGLRRLGLAMGFLIAGHSVGAAAGAYLGGALFDRFTGYDMLWTVSIGLAAAASLMAMTLREPVARRAT